MLLTQVIYGVIIENDKICEREMANSENFFRRDVMADTIGTKEASEEWGYPQSTIRRWCLKGLIPFATQDAPGSPWHIPKSAKCPRPIKNKKTGERK